MLPVWVSFWFTAQDPCQRQPQQVPPRAARVGFRPHLGLSTIGLIAPLVETLRFEPLRSVQFSTPSKCQGFQQLLCPVYWLPCLPASLGWAGVGLQDLWSDWGAESPLLWATPTLPCTLLLPANQLSAQAPATALLPSLQGSFLPFPPACFPIHLRGMGPGLLDRK